MAFKDATIDLPPYGVEVIGYNKDWRDEDYNPHGTRVSFYNDDGSWTYAKWCGQHDEWHTRNTADKNWQGKFSSAPMPPTHWIEKPVFTNKK